MTDNKIIKALKELLETASYNGDLQSAETISKALDLINRQKAEIEISKTKSFKQQLKKELHRLTVEEIKAEAIKVFAEIIVSDYPEMEYYLDNIVKEMIGAQQ